MFLVFTGISSCFLSFNFLFNCLLIYKFKCEITFYTKCSVNEVKNMKNQIVDTKSLVTACTTYTAVVQNIVHNQSTIEQIPRILERFKTIKKIKDAKKLLQEEWNISDNVTRYPVCGSLLISTKEDNSSFIVNYEYKNKNSTFVYKK